MRDRDPPALRIDLSVPATLDISTCDKGEFPSWTLWEVVDGANSHYASGQLDTVYAELEAILASMIIDRGQ
jgi:hypothetical protein